MTTPPILSSLRRALPRLPRRQPPPLHKTCPRRHKSTSSSAPGPGPDPSSRASRILSRLPPSLQRYASRLRGAPVSHVVAFLALHELTAVVPLLGLFGLFHYTDHVPVGYVTEHYGAYVGEGLARFERYFRRKGWFGFGEGDGDGEADVAAAGEGGALDRWQKDGRYKVVVEVALAYAITKALLPVRIVASLWATPWFAGVLGRLQMLVRRKRPPQ